MSDMDSAQAADEMLASAQRVARIARDLCGGDYADVVSHDGFSFARAQYVDFTGAPDWPVSRILSEGAALWLEQPAGSSMWPDRPDEQVRTGFGVPITLPGGMVIGALVVGLETPAPRDEATMERLQELAQLVTVGFERQVTLAELSRTTDDLKAALEDARRHQQRLQVALELAKVHVWEVDYARPREGGGELPPLGAGVTQIQARVDMWSAVHPHDQPMARELWDRHLAEGAPYEINHRVKAPDGRNVWLRAAVKAFRGDDGEVERIIGAYRNIDAEFRSARELEKARDAAEAANQAKTAFLATMSHEIRTPLNGVLGMAQVMANNPLEAGQRERLDVIRTSGESLLAILNDILDLSKVEAGKLTLEEVDFDICEVAGATHAAFAALATRKGLAFDVSVAAPARGTYRGDPTRLRQILDNLVSNAIKFTETGSVWVTVGRAGRNLRIKVRDTGIGIDPECAEQLFQKFEQADASTTRRFGGTGLGLSICRELVAMMGGAVRLKSGSGKGATFTVDLPLAQVTDGAAHAHGDPGAADAVDLTEAPLRVLAAEDNAVNQAVLRALLNQIGVDPLIVENGVDAVAAWEQGDWDVILMDVQMPRMDGPTATQFIRSRELALGRPRTPIVALTANSMSHQVTEYLAVGMDAFVPKPIEVAKLFEALQAVLAGPESVSRVA